MSIFNYSEGEVTVFAYYGLRPYRFDTFVNAFLILIECTGALQRHHFCHMDLCECIEKKRHCLIDFYYEPILCTLSILNIVASDWCF